MAEVMDDIRRTSIAKALQRHSEPVMECNLSILQILIDRNESPAGPGWSDEGLIARRCEIFEDDYKIPEMSTPISTPRDLLSDELRAELIAATSLNGCRAAPVEAERNAQWFSDVQDEIQTKDFEAADFPPIDLEYLCTLASAITGP
jgi:hypothetical protein